MIGTTELTPQIVEQLTAPLDKLSDHKRLLIATETRAAARTVFGSPLRSRPSELLKKLKALRKRCDTDPDVSHEIPEDLSPALGAAEEFEIAAVRSSPEGLRRSVDLAIATLEVDKTVAHDRKGGRRRDPRLDRFAFRLAVIYETHVGAPPTFTQDTETGNEVSPFGLFGYEAFYLFCPFGPGNGQVREALRHAVASHRDVAFLAPAELDTLLKPEP